MTYHPLTKDTGQTPERRREEAESILKMLDGHEDELTPKEYDFVTQIVDQDWCSPKQLLWLRDLKEKYCD